jgi:deoxycytidine triphosphate deaminase
MSIRPDHWIERMAVEHRMIEPFVDDQVRSGVISTAFRHALTCVVGDEFKVFTTSSTPSSIEGFRSNRSSTSGRTSAYPAELVRAGEHHRAFASRATS